MIEIFLPDRSLLVHEIWHFFVATIVAIFLFRRFKDWRLVLVVFFTSFFLDADHFLEGLWFNGLNFRPLLTTQPGIFWEKTGKMTILLHSWEIILVILWWGKKFRQWPLALTVSSAIFGHLLLDQFTYSIFSKMPIFEYFLIFRIFHLFDFRKICGGC